MKIVVLETTGENEMASASVDVGLDEGCTCFVP